MDASTTPDSAIRQAQVVLPASDFDATIGFFTTELGFRLDVIQPADDPTVAVLSGHGLCLRLDRAATNDPGSIVIRRDGPVGPQSSLTAPNGTHVQFVEAEPSLEMPPLDQAFVISRAADSGWGLGRAAMQYRDLIPDREGGRFIASHIAIPDGGPVPDYVHFHKIRFQMIFCRRGWTRLVYEDQGEPFILEAGDCVLQPPEIRHRVLEASDGLEVVEIGCPAVHETHADHDMDLPNETLNPDRDFNGQRFVRHLAAGAPWFPWRVTGFEARDTGIGAATAGEASAKVVRPLDDRVVDGSAAVTTSHDAEFVFLFVLDGSVVVESEAHGTHRLDAGDSVTIPAGLAHRLFDPSSDLELLEVTLAEQFTTTIQP